MKANLFFIFSFILLMGCSTEENISPIQKQLLLRINTSETATYDRVNTQEIDNLSGYLFENGILSEVYSNLSVGNGGSVKGMTVPDKPDAHLYLLANIKNALEDRLFIKDSFSEASFRTLVLVSEPLSGKGVPLAMAGYRDVGSILADEAMEFGVTRSFARIDVDPASGVAIKSISVEHVAQSGYLLTQSSVQTPENTKWGELEKNYDHPLEAKEEGIFYFYEQTGLAPVVTVTAQINGREKTVITTLPDIIKRNHIYNLIITTDGVGIEAVVQELPWIEGVENVEVNPDLIKRIKIDPSQSEWSSDIRLNEGRDTLFVPFWGGDFRLALDTSSDIEVTVEGADVTLVPVNDIENALLGNLWNISIPAKAINSNSHDYIRLKLHNKNLTHYYNDQVVISVSKGTYTHRIELDGITSADGLTSNSVQYLVNFEVSPTDGNVAAIIRPLRPFDANSEEVSILHHGEEIKKVFLKNDAFKFREVSFSSESGDNTLTIMDRDLGAAGTDVPGELFVIGDVIPFDQAGATWGFSTHKDDYSGAGRITAPTHNYGTKWFAGSGGKDESVDPCPKGWHVMSQAETLMLINAGTTLPQGTLSTTAGTLGGTVTFGDKEVTYTLADTSVTFNSKSGYWLSGNIWAGSDGWPNGWYTSSRSGNNLTRFAFGYQASRRMEIISRYNTTHGFQLRCAKDRTPAP